MCGIAGLLDRRKSLSEDALKARARAMNDTLSHRGPDGDGFWVSAPDGVALAHRRLAIIDLSPGGAQPQISGDGRFVITYNGEVYNYRALRRELEEGGQRFHTESDTEVMLASFSRWGIKAAVERFIGMFAFAVWDRRERLLVLVRDRLGIKPMYYADLGSRLLFGSELKALRADSTWSPTLDRDATAGYFRHGYVPSPLTIYREARKLPPGHMLTVAEGKPPVVEMYWDARQIAIEGARRAALGSMEPAEAVEALDRLLRDAVSLRMIADVPLGAFLSGGIDSSTVVALMQAQSNRPVRTFSIGFREASHNEAAHAKAVAGHLRTDHTELYVEPTHARELIPRLPEWYDEPFADSSQLPTYLVAEMARQHVTVALSGDGGDEVFAGYSRYFWTARFWRNISLAPAPLRKLVALIARLPSAAAWDCLFGCLPGRLRIERGGERMHNLATILEGLSPDAVYRHLISLWKSPEEVVVSGREPESILWDRALAQEVPELIPRLELIDLVTYLPDDILTKVDRATMAVSLEGRVPLIDHRVVEFAATLPLALKVRDGQGKWLLRQVLSRYVPDALVDRPKMGFGVPIGEWLRGPLRAWAEELLDPAKLRSDGILRPEPITRLWQDHLAGRRDGQYPLWVVLMFQAWRQRWPTPV